MQNELLKEARTIVEERRSSVVLGIKGEPNREGVFQWVEGPPTAGKPAVLAYNANSGPLRNAQVLIFQHVFADSAPSCKTQIDMRQTMR